MSIAFPTDKDRIIDELDDRYDLQLSDEEYECLRKLTKADLFTLTLLLSRIHKNAGRTALRGDK